MSVACETAAPSDDTIMNNIKKGRSKAKFLLGSKNTHGKFFITPECDAIKKSRILMTW